VSRADGRNQTFSQGMGSRPAVRASFDAKCARRGEGDERSSHRRYPVTDVRLARLEMRVNELEARLAALEAGPRPPVAREQMRLASEYYRAVEQVVAS
jgi:hypothetical protein